MNEVPQTFRARLHDLESDLATAVARVRFLEDAGDDVTSEVRRVAEAITRISTLSSEAAERMRAAEIPYEDLVASAAELSALRSRLSRAVDQFLERTQPMIVERPAPAGTRT